MRNFCCMASPLKRQHFHCLKKHKRVDQQGEYKKLKHRICAFIVWGGNSGQSAARLMSLRVVSPHCPWRGNEAFTAWHREICSASSWPHRHPRVGIIGGQAKNAVKALRPCMRIEAALRNRPRKKRPAHRHRQSVCEAGESKPVSSSK